MPRLRTLTGGRDATTAVIPGKGTLSIGHPRTACPPGYEWRALSEFARLESGHTPTRARSEYWDGSIPWLSIPDATNNHGRVIFDTAQHVSETGVANSSTRLLPPGTVCLSRTASVGYVIQMGVEMCTSQDFVNWVCGPDLNPAYLRYILMFEQESIRRFAHGTTHQTMYYPEAKALHAMMPSRLIQDSVAEVLGALDDKMVENRAVVQDIDELVLCLFLQATEGAEKSPLSSIALVNPSTLASAGHGTLRYVDIGALGVGSMPLPIQTAWSDAPSRARRPVNKGDVLWSTVRPNLRAHALSLYEGSDLIASTGLAVIRPIEGDYAFVYECVRTAAFTSHLVSSAAGSAYPAVRPGDIGCGPVPCLSIADRRSFQSAAGPLRQRQWASLVENRSLAALRDALLPKLMSGELRVRDAEKQVEEVV